MKSESDALNRLTDLQSEVGCHYLIKNNGEIIKMVPDLYIAWHAGKSLWKNYRSLNQNPLELKLQTQDMSMVIKNLQKNK